MSTIYFIYLVFEGLNSSDKMLLLGFVGTSRKLAPAGENRPTTDVLSKLANALDTATDYLMNGSTDEAADVNISDKELHSLFKKVSALSSDRNNVVKEFLEAFVFKADVQEGLVH